MNFSRKGRSQLRGNARASDGGFQGAMDHEATMSRRFGRQVGDWIKLRCGDLVADIADERHIGRVEAIRQGVFVTVRWLDTGWTSEVPIERLALATPRPKITR